MKKNLRFAILAASTFILNVAAYAASGGPDTYGYTWKDSNEPGGPTYQWIEIATPAGGSGTYRSAINCDDCHEANIPLGFNFPYYGTNFNTVSIGSNGVVYFENVYLGLSNSCIPGTPSYTMSQYRFIAHLWDDLAPNYQGGIYTQAFPNYFVIEYYNIVPCCATGDGDTWQVILFSNGNILMQYKELSNQGLQSDFTVGIQNNPTTGLQYKCDATGIALANNRAILFSPPTFSCTSVAQNILGPNTGFCTGSNVVLSSGATAIAQTWSDNTTNTTLTVNVAGSYSILVLDTNGCTLRDTIAVAENPLPTVNLGPDATACGSNVLDAGNAGATYLWSDNSTSQLLTVTSSGTYSVTVTDANGCSNTDAVNVTINPVPVVALGTDITQCGGTATLDAGNAGMNYMWSDNSTAQTLVVSTTGTYSVTVTDPVTSCAGTGSINVTINALPTVALGADVVQCGGSVLLDAGNAGASFLWSDNSTAQTLSVTSSGVYSVAVTDANSCNGSDTITVTINAVPVVALGADVAQCGSVMLDAGNAGMNYLWSDSTVTQTLTTTTSGTYYVDVTDPGTGCMGSDTINVTVNPNPVVALGADVAQCGGTVTLDAANAGASYLWNDGTTTQTLIASTSGVYYVTVTDTNSCSGSDTVNVTINTPPTVGFTLSTTTVCVDDGSFTLTGGTPAGGTYSGTGVGAGMFSPSTAGTGTHAITYSYTDSNNCTATAQQSVTVNACVGIVENAMGGVSIYPNPTGGMFTIETASVTPVTVEVFNAIGEVVTAEQVNAGGIIRVDLSGKENGVYFVRITGENINRIEKVMLQQ